MEEGAADPHAKPVEGAVLLPLPGLICLQAQGQGGTLDASIKPKCRIAGLPQEPRKRVEAAMGQGARMARLVEAHRQGVLRNIRIELLVQGGLPMALNSELAGLPAWAAAAAALADRIARGQVLDWARRTILLAGMDTEEDDPQRWGLLHPLDAALEEAVLQALREGPVDAHWADALVVLPGNEARYAALRSELSQRLPRAKVCTADSLTALHSPDVTSRRTRVGRMWFPLVSTQGATLHRIQVAVAPWKPTRGELAPVEVIYLPMPDRDLAAERLTQAVPQLLKAWREEELPPSPPQWKAVVQLPSCLVGAGGDSYELALAIADRMARGREWPGPGRVLATGGVSSAAGDLCQVMNVGGTAELGMLKPGPDDANLKLDVMLAQAQQGDTVLLPDQESWRHQVAARLGPMADDGSARTPAGALVAFVRQVLP